MEHKCECNPGTTHDETEITMENMTS